MRRQAHSSRFVEYAGYLILGGLVGYASFCFIAPGLLFNSDATDLFHRTWLRDLATLQINENDDDSRSVALIFIIVGVATGWMAKSITELWWRKRDRRRDYGSAVTQCAETPFPGLKRRLLPGLLGLAIGAIVGAVGVQSSVYHNWDAPLHSARAEWFGRYLMESAIDEKQESLPWNHAWLMARAAIACAIPAAMVGLAIGLVTRHLYGLSHQEDGE